MTQLARRWGTMCFWLCIGISIVGGTAAFLFAEVGFLVAAIADGSGYYLQFARNAAAGLGVTFDGLHASNGYHPLWLGLLWLCFGAFHQSSDWMFREIGLLCVYLLVTSAIVFRHVLRTILSDSAVVAGAVVYLLLGMLTLNLMETQILLLTLSLLLWAASSYYLAHGPRQLAALRFGFVLGLSILSRLEMAFLALGIGLLGMAEVLRSQQRWDAFRRLTLIVSAASLTVVPYLLYNLHQFGSIVPISGQLESIFPQTNLPRLAQTLKEVGRTRLVAIAACVIFLSWMALRTRNTRAPAHPGERFLHWSAILITLVYLVTVTHDVLFTKWQLYWHHAALIPAAGLIVAIVWQRTEVITSLMRSRSIRGLVVGFGGLCTIALVNRMRAGSVEDDWRRRCYEVAVWLRQNTEPTDRIAMRVAEVTGYFADRATVDLLGLGAGLELQEAIRTRSLRKYLHDAGVRYLVYVIWQDQTHSPHVEAVGGNANLSEGDYVAASLHFHSELYGVYSDPIAVRQTEEVFRSKANGGSESVVVWRFGNQSASH